MVSKQILDPDSITLGLVDSSGEATRVTVALDFSDFGLEDMRRVARLLGPGAWLDQAETTCAFLFVAAGRQVDLDDESFPVFADALKPMWAGDTSMLRVGD